jgi:hypothetical protein
MGELPVAKHQEDRQWQVQAFAVALTYQIVRFLRGLRLCAPVGPEVDLSVFLSVSSICALARRR